MSSFRYMAAIAPAPARTGLRSDSADRHVPSLRRGRSPKEGEACGPDRKSGRTAHRPEAQNRRTVRSGGQRGGRSRMPGRFGAFAAALFAAGIASGQEQPSVRARIEPDSIMIGDRFEYVIEVDKDQVQVVEFPEFHPDGSGIELVRSLPVDTLARDGRAQKLRKRYVLAAFDEGNYALGKAGVLYAGKNIVDTLYSDDSLYLHVATFQIDSTSHSIYDLKAQKTLPFRFGEVSGYVKWGLLALLALLAALYATQKLLARHGRSVGSLFRSAPPQPPHVVAIQALEALHHQKLWQNNRYKLYYSGLTDILRTYIAARYGIGAMEMTSDEIIEAMRRIDDMPQKSAMDLTAILRDADLVKFAKATPDAEQNEADYLKAYYFVEETKLVEEEPAGDNEPSAPES